MTAIILHSISRNILSTVRKIPRLSTQNFSHIRYRIPCLPLFSLQQLHFKIQQKQGPGLLSSVSRYYCSTEIDTSTYEVVSDETLESLTEYLEELVESEQAPEDSDITFSTGVLTLYLGSAGTYVINKQTPNKQIWLSSPTSGPKRYDFINNVWIYKHTGVTLHDLLTEELSKVFKTKTDFSKCAYGGNESH